MGIGANVVVHDDAHRVLLARYDPAAEIDDEDASTRWWLPADELSAFQHPDEAARTALEEIEGLTLRSLELRHIQSFRGRRGWHISFDYPAQATGEPRPGAVTAEWFDRQALPATLHGNWERETIDNVLR
jgi:ADP-ribose pyrophosphatase YjhB (NUDIX family)